MAFLSHFGLWQNSRRWSQGRALVMCICVITLSPESAELLGNAHPFH